MLKTLRSRLVLSYAGLVLFTLVLASAASLWLFGRNLEQAAHRDMVNSAVRLGNTFADIAASGDPEQLRRAQILVRPRGLVAGQIMIVDGSGRPLAGLTAAADEFLRGTYPPRPPDPATGLPPIDQASLPSGLRVTYVSVRIPAEIADAAQRPRAAFLTLVRPARELRGQWRVLLGPVALVGSLALLLGTLIALALARSITRPVEEMTRASERIARGDYATEVPVRGGDEIGRLASAFNSMAREVGNAHRSQRELVANVSHDLRTPLTTIRGFAGALLDGTARTGDQQHHAAEAIDGAAARMETLVATLIELARLEGRQTPMRLGPTWVDELLAALAAAQGPHAEQHGVLLTFATHPGLAVMADADWLTRALGNIVDNAIRHSPAGTRVHVAAGPAAGDSVEILVEDNGPGIASEDLPRVFERFYRGDKSRSAGGSGLGLAIAEEIITRHGGTIRIDSQPGHGTQVVVALPAAGAASAST